MALRHFELDDKGICTADETTPGIWQIQRTTPYGQKHIVMLTDATILYLAGLIEESKPPVNA